MAVSVTETFSGTELSPVMVAQDGPVAHVWMRRNIQEDTKAPEHGDGDPYTFWHAEEISFDIAGSPTVEQIEADFDDIWNEQIESGKTVDEKIADVALSASDNQDALAELGDSVADNADALAELGDIVAKLQGGE